MNLERGLSGRRRQIFAQTQNLNCIFIMEIAGRMLCKCRRRRKFVDFRSLIPFLCECKKRVAECVCTN